MTIIIIALWLLCFLWLTWALNRTHKHGMYFYENKMAITKETTK